MQLMRLEVKNWCQHTFRVCKFTRGLVAILGKIGSGKSNLLGAICWLLTGENPNSGVKAENVSQLSTGEDSAYARLEFEHAGHFVVVTRYLLPEKEQATLVVDDVEVARGDKAVTAHIEQLLGIDSKFISRFVIVAQTELFAFIEEGPAETDRFFQKLFGTVNAEKCADAINKQVSKLVIPEIVTPSAELAEHISTIERKQQELEEQIRPLPSADEFIAAQTKHRKTIQDWETMEGVAKEINELGLQVKKCVEKSAELAHAVEERDKDLQALKDVIAGNQEANTQAKAALNHLATYRQIARVKEAAKTRLAEIAQLRANDLAPAVVTEAARTAALQAQQAADAALNTAKEFVRTFTAAGMANCPTCHTPVSDLSAEIARVQKTLPALEEAAADAYNARVRLDKDASDWSTWQQRQQKLTAEESQLLSSSKTFANINAPEVSEEELVKQIADHDNLHKALAEIEPIAQRTREKKAETDGLLAAVTAQREKKIAELNTFSVKEVDFELAKTELMLLNQQFVTRQELERDKAQLDAAHSSMLAQFVDTQKAEHTAAVCRKWIEVAETAKAALKAAPKLVTKRNLQRLEIAINELLQVFGVDFFIRAAADDSSSFVAEFFDGRKQPAKRLSYGQKTVLALAFRVAVNSLFAENIGLLALDEPTAYLDQQRIKALAPVFEKLREFSTARGLQCLLVTHEMSLAHLFESTVELDA